MPLTDDLILLAESEQDLQNSDEQSRNLCQNFPDGNKPKEDQSTDMFDKSAKLKKHISKTWTIGDINIEEDRIYKYSRLLTHVKVPVRCLFKE